MIPDTPNKKTKNKEPQEKTDLTKNQHLKDENEKFSPGEPDDYNAEEFSTD